ncbi:hypothetical protein [Serratia symbiotica]|uniref:Uncharacterized protein n=1 Tax=Serratia symbiotica TaxID=138074 RepID=A0A7D5NQF3_9GAMM|nr:hypothetical protein SYMBAF_05060 [Serratia symbiotica]
MDHSPERIRVPRLIATLESIIMWLSGYLFEKKDVFKIPGEHREASQANIAVNAGGECIQTFSADIKISLTG